MNKNLLIHIITPFIVCFLCLGILIIAIIKPYDKLKVYLNIAFMDDFKIKPDGSTQGLVIKENEINDDYSGATDSDGEIIIPQFGEMYAILKCDAFDTDIPVYYGSTPELLERGACQASGSVFAGNKGNTVISAHKDTFFYDLDKIKPGDIITVSTGYGKFTYKAVETVEFDKNNNKYVSASDETKLTLYTCKKDIFGSPDTRTGVICEPVEKIFYTGGSR